MKSTNNGHNILAHTQLSSIGGFSLAIISKSTTSVCVLRVYVFQSCYREKGKGKGLLDFIFLAGWWFHIWKQIESPPTPPFYAWLFLHF